MGYNPSFNPQIGGGVPGQPFYPGQSIPPNAVGGDNKADRDGDGNGDSTDGSEGGNGSSEQADADKEGGGAPKEGDNEGKTQATPKEAAEPAEGKKAKQDKKEGGKKLSMSAVAASAAPSTAS